MAFRLNSLTIGGCNPNNIPNQHRSIRVDTVQCNLALPGSAVNFRCLHTIIVNSEPRAVEIYPTVNDVICIDGGQS